ncbi:MAG: class I SAM-dependent methyltransferase [Candidatus Bathyarchaeota archaeon]|nr:class I SAM-dependent methyltransferase [Candidatus Bathyarchaeota archaeon]
METEKLRDKITGTIASLTKYSSHGSAVVDAVESLRRLDEILADQTDENLIKIHHYMRGIRAGVDQLKEYAPSIEEVLDEIGRWVEERFIERTYTVSGRLEMAPLKAEGFILDIGGGGEGIIGKLNGRQVVSIDLSAGELEETDNESLKIVMDATDLKFTPSQFDAATSFFTLLYIDREKQERVSREVHRVLKEEGRFLIWDVEIPEKVEGKPFFLVRLEISLPGEKVNTGYGVRMARQDKEGIRDLAERTGFEVADEWSEGEIFYLELRKARTP